MNQKREKTKLPRNVWIVGITSFMTDVSSEMIANILPLFLKNVLGVKTAVIGLIEGVAESLASLLKVFSGWISDRLRLRKVLAVLGYGISTLSKRLTILPVPGAWWPAPAGATGWARGCAPRRATPWWPIRSQPERRGLAFGFHRAADTAGAFLGLIIALAMVWWLQSGSADLKEHTFRVLVLISLGPALLAVFILALGARDIKPAGGNERPRFAFHSLGQDFAYFLLVVGVFEMGNSSDAFLILRAQERGLTISGILAMLIAFNLVYTLISTPAGRLSDRVGRRRVIVAGWLFYVLIYLGMALARSAPQVVVLYILYGVYYGLSYGTAKALVADMVRPEVRGMAYGTYNAVLGLADLPASLIAGILWSGIGRWRGFGPAAPFFFGAAMALLAVVLFLGWKPEAGKEA